MLPVDRIVIVNDLVFAELSNVNDPELDLPRELKVYVVAVALVTVIGLRESEMLNRRINVLSASVAQLPSPFAV